MYATYFDSRYSFSIMIVLNFILFMLIAVGQAAIFITVKATSMENNTNKQSSELKLAYRLATVVVSDFLCWFPIGVLGLMAASGYAISGEVNVAMAIFVLPLNSALNPFLYTLNAVMEKRSKKRLETLTKTIRSRIQTEMAKDRGGK